MLLLVLPLRSQDSAVGAVASLCDGRWRRVEVTDSLLPKVLDWLCGVSRLQFCRYWGRLVRDQAAGA
jgi:hypothetical protein